MALNTRKHRKYDNKVFAPQPFQYSILPPFPVKVAHGDTSYQAPDPENFLILAEFFGD